MNRGSKPDLERLATLRGAARSYFQRKQMWTRILFYVAAACECLLFGAMLFFFDFSDRFYWFIFFGLCSVYTPLVIFILRNSVMLDRFFYKLLLELKFEDTRNSEDSTPSFEFHGEMEGRDEVQSFLEKKDRWAKVIFWIAGCFEGILWLTTFSFMDFTSQIDRFLFVGFLAVYTPLIISAWRNSFAIDRVYYGLVDELKYAGRGTVK